MFIKVNLSWINVEIACDCLGLTRSNYYAWRANQEKRAKRIAGHQKLLTQIKENFNKSKDRYGSIKITHTLRKSGIKCNHKLVAKLMQQNNLHSIVKKKFKATTNSKHELAVFPNILAREFKVERPNYAWVGDITYVSTDEGWLYLATVLDLYSNKVIGFATSERINKELVISALNKALQNRNYPKGVIVHSDRGSQYASNAYKAILEKHQLVGSMSRKGNCWDNAVAENFFGIIKKEYIYQTKFTTRVKAQLGIFDYIESWYNNHRIHSKLNYLSPVEFEELNQPKLKQIVKNIKNQEKLLQL